MRGASPGRASSPAWPQQVWLLPCLAAKGRGSGVKLPGWDLGSVNNSASYLVSLPQFPHLHPRGLQHRS